jgi:hypothetical protein
MVKTRADSTLRTGSLGGALGGILGQAQRNINTLGRQATRATKLDQVRRNIRPIVASKPIPAQNAMFFANRPADNPKPFAGDDLRKQIQQFYDSMGGLKSKLAKPFDGKSDEQEQQDALNVGAVGQFGLNKVTDAVKKATNFAHHDKPFTAPERPDLDTVQRVREQVDIALRDNTWAPYERDKILDSYRNFVKKFVADDGDDLKELNNWAVQSAFKQLTVQARKAQDADQEQGGNGFTNMFGLAQENPTATDDLGKFYSGNLLSASDDKYAQGFILSADANGWFKIQSIKDLRHQIATEARDNPAFAARLIAGMSAYGAYGGGTDKYAGQRIQYDKRNNPVAATFNVDDENALGTFLSSIAVDQEQAMNSDELQPWDTIMDQHAAQNNQIAQAPSYGDQTPAAPRGRRGYGYGGGGGFGGGGGGGGISYTDSDQLKQLINGIARSRLGMTLNDQQIAEFVTDYHSKEAAYVNSRIAGQNGMQLDPESQAAAWIESHFRDPMAAQQANTYISSLASFLLGGSFGSQS